MAIAGWVMSGCVGPSLALEEGPLPPSEARVLVQPDNFDADRLAAAVFAETNRRRAELGLRPLRAYKFLRQAADLQAGMNAMLGFPSHDNPLIGRGTPYDRVLAAGIRPGAVAENVLMVPMRWSPGNRGERVITDDEGNRTWIDAGTGEALPWPTYAALARRMLDHWMNSPGHRANIVNPDFRYLACGVATGRSLQQRDIVYGAQVFMSQPPRRNPIN